MNFRYPASMALLFAGASVVQVAQGMATDRGEVQASHLNPIVVTATRSSQRVADTLAATTVITRAEIERLQPRSVQELLRWTPGVSVTNSGGLGKATSIHIRGTNSDHVLVLINGVRYTSATLGTPAIADIPVGLIERIEIVRGPRSSLYGADAIGGVIQIFTRDGSDIQGGVQPYARVGGGTYGTYSGVAGISGRTDDSHFNLSVSRKKTDGFNAFNCDGCFSGPQPDDDGYARTAGSLRAGFTLADAVHVNLHATRIEAQVDFDGFYNSADSLRQIVGASVAGQLADAWRMELALGHALDETANYSDGVFKTSFETAINTLRWKNNLSWSPQQQMTFGVDYRAAKIDSTTDYTETRRDTVGAYGQYRGRFGSQEFRVALRADNHDEFDDSITGSINYGWHVSSVHVLTLSYGTAYKAPSFNELYFPGFGNPNLKPEESESVELGFKANRDWGNWSIYAYQTKVDDLISSVRVAPFVFKARNVNEARIRGVEASINAILGPWNVNTSASYVDAENRSEGANQGNQLPGRPKYSAQVRVNRDFGRVNVGSSLRYGGARYNSGNTVKLDDFVLFELRGGVDVTRTLQLQARISNLFDADYQTNNGYNQAGRTVFVSVSYRP